ncbi:MAG: hypothetical protein ACK5Z5_06550 [Neisseriaceae bacterium]|jgi:hypothetical protein
MAIINNRDIKILEILKLMGWVREDLLAKWVGVEYKERKDKVNMQRIAKRLEDDGFIVRVKQIVGNPFYWSLGKRGVDYIGGFKQSKFSLIKSRHDDLVCELIISKLLVNPEFEVVTDRIITLSNEHLVRVVSGGKMKLVECVVPDVVIDGVAYEVELTRKTADKYRKKIGDYVKDINSGKFKEVLIYTDKSIASFINYHAVKNNPSFKFMVFSGTNIINAVEWQYDDLEALQEHNQSLVSRINVDQNSGKIFHE